MRCPILFWKFEMLNNSHSKTKVNFIVMYFSQWSFYSLLYDMFLFLLLRAMDAYNWLHLLYANFTMSIHTTFAYCSCCYIVYSLSWKHFELKITISNTTCSIRYVYRSRASEITLSFSSGSYWLVFDFYVVSRVLLVVCCFCVSF